MYIMTKNKWKKTVFKKKMYMMPNLQPNLK